MQSWGKIGDIYQSAITQPGTDGLYAEFSGMKSSAIMEPAYVTAEAPVTRRSCDARIGAFQTRPTSRNTFENKPSRQ